MGDINLKYGASGQAITITLASLADAGIRESDAVDNSTDLFMDALGMVKVTTGASGGDAGDVVCVYLAGTVDGGTTYSGECTGSDGALTTTRNLVLVDTIKANVATTTFYSRTFSVAAAFGGVLPQKWTIVVENKTGAAFDADAADHWVKYQGVHAQAA